MKENKLNNQYPCEDEIAYQQQQNQQQQNQYFSPFNEIVELDKNK